MSRVTDYDSISSQYDRRYQGQGYPGVEQALFEFLSSEEQLAALEVGCGTGHWLKVLEGRIGFLVGFDLSANMLNRAQSEMSAVPLVRGRAEELPYRACCFDRLFCLNAFHHFAEKDKFLTEARRVLCPHGGLMILGLDPHSALDRWWVYDYFHETLELDKERYPSTQKLRADMAHCGFLQCETLVAEHLTLQMSAHTAIARGLLDKSYTSQLTILSTGEYEEGFNRVNRAIASEKERGVELMLVADLRLYATIGWLGE
ncbi:MAG: class I SAM-dependent methyltransferase [Candidatus Binatia bacterium]